MAPPTEPMDTAAPKAPRLFKVFCVLTIVGNGLLFLINLFKTGMLLVGIDSGGVGAQAAGPLKLLMVVVMLTCVGAALGAALMLGGRRLGFRIYAASNVVHLGATVCVALLWIMTIYLSVVGVLLLFYSLVPLGFLLYFGLNKAWLR